LARRRGCSLELHGVAFRWFVCVCGSCEERDDVGEGEAAQAHEEECCQGRPHCWELRCASEDGRGRAEEMAGPNSARLKEIETWWWWKKKSVARTKKGSADKAAVQHRHRCEDATALRRVDTSSSIPVETTSLAGTRGAMARAGAAAARQGRSGSARCSLTESLEQLAAASQRLADVAAEALGLEAEPIRDVPGFETHVEAARRTLLEKFDPNNIEAYDGSDAMEKVRSAHLETAIEMYTIMVETSHQDPDLASKIGDSLFKELMEYYRTAQHTNERVIFTTEQRTALESAFLLKPKLNTAEKRALAKTCDLNPRQVEVWVRPLFCLQELI
jgi:hypothetical protein